MKAFVVAKEMRRGTVYVSGYDISDNIYTYGTLLRAQCFSSRKEADKIALNVSGKVLLCEISVKSTDIEIGDKVRDRWGQVGKVAKVYEDFYDLVKKVTFYSMTADQWLAQQNPPFTKDNLREKWFSIDLDDGGTVWSCESKLNKLKL